MDPWIHRRRADLSGSSRATAAAFDEIVAGSLEISRHGASCSVGWRNDSGAQLRRVGGRRAENASEPALDGCNMDGELCRDLAAHRLRTRPNRRSGTASDNAHPLGSEMT